MLLHESADFIGISNDLLIKSLFIDSGFVATKRVNLVFLMFATRDI